MSTAYRPRQTDQPWQRDTALTRENQKCVGWYWAIWLVAPWLLMAEGVDLVVAAYVIFGVLGVVFMGVLKLQRHGVKFCPDCKAGNPIDANVCQRCGARPAQEGDAPCAAS